MKRVPVLFALLAILLMPSPSVAEFDPAAYRPISQADLVKDAKANAGKKFVVTDPFQFCGSDFCVQLRKTKINTRDYYCVTLGPLCLVRFYIRKDHPDAAIVSTLRKGDPLVVYGTFDFQGSDYRFMIVDRLEVRKP